MPYLPLVMCTIWLHGYQKCVPYGLIVFSNVYIWFWLHAHDLLAGYNADAYLVQVLLAVSTDSFLTSSVGRAFKLRVHGSNHISGH